jgi:hypothetical protein
MLLQHPGEVLTREDIRNRLWPNDTTVEFEHSISAAMNRLRQTLGDFAENPSILRPFLAGVIVSYVRWTGRTGSFFLHSTVSLQHNEARRRRA